jgi:hypothetical protein
MDAVLSNIMTSGTIGCLLFFIPDLYFVELKHDMLLCQMHKPFCR